MAWISLGALVRELRDGELVVGSGADADWRIPTADLMPRHFVLTVHGLNTSIRASSADIVVVVNGEQLSGQYHLLNDGDVISAGRGRFIYGETEARTDAAEPPAAGRAYLVDERGNAAYELLNQSTTIGRDASNAIVVSDARASRFHGEVRREAGGFALHSMGSSGTRLNGTAMTGPRLLREGDVLEIAYTPFRFTLEPPAANVRIVHPVIAHNDASASKDTVMRDRVTMESRVTAAPPDARGMVRIVVVLGVLVAVALSVWIALRR